MGSLFGLDFTTIGPIAGAITGLGGVAVATYSAVSLSRKQAEDAKSGKTHETAEQRSIAMREMELALEGLGRELSRVRKERDDLELKVDRIDLRIGALIEQNNELQKHVHDCEKRERRLHALIADLGGENP